MSKARKKAAKKTRKTTAKKKTARKSRRGMRKGDVVLPTSWLKAKKKAPKRKPVAKAAKEHKVSPKKWAAWTAAKRKLAKQFF